MPATKVTCPHCAKPVKTTPHPAPGKRIRCAGCGNRFPVPPEDEAKTAPGSKRRRPRKKETEKRHTALWVGLGAATLALVVAVVILALRRGGKKEDKQQAAASPPSPALPVIEQPAPLRTDPVPAPESKPEPKPVPAPAVKPVPPPKRPVPPAKDRIDQAIDRGIRYLRGIQTASGTWALDDKHMVGLAALPGLTLVECGVNPYDPQVQKATQYMRDRVDKLDRTYEIALAILFLDHMGNPSDRDLIQTLALRLIAGQKNSGGWTYNCPILDSRDAHHLLVVLKDIQPENPNDLFTTGPEGLPLKQPGIAGRGAPSPSGLTTSTSGSRTPPAPSTGVSTREPATPPSGAVGATGAPRLGAPTASRPREPSGAGGSTLPAPSPPPAKDGSTLAPPGDPGKNKTPGKKPPPKKPGGRLSLVGRRALAALPKELKKIPALQPPKKARNLPATEDQATDNSNTQFAILALWAAGRHGVPMERAMALLVARFRVSQEARNGGWDYHYRRGGTGITSPAMTGAGLLGLAVGLSYTAQPGPDGKRKKSVDNPLVKKGLQELARHIGHPQKGPRAVRRQHALNLYFLWTVERVAVIYGVKHIDKKDWYGWGSEEVLDHQFDDGHWQAGGYPGSTNVTDTCLALLFLQRANLAKDLSKKLENALDVKGADPR